MHNDTTVIHIQSARKQHQLLTSLQSAFIPSDLNLEAYCALDLLELFVTKNKRLPASRMTCNACWGNISQLMKQPPGSSPMDE